MPAIFERDKPIGKGSFEYGNGFNAAYEHYLEYGNGFNAGYNLYQIQISSYRR